MRPADFLVALLLLGTTCAHAADYTLADGRVHFSTPDNWPRIMMAQGNPEMMAFQVPLPEGAHQDVLARVTVTSQKITDIAAFQLYVSARLADAHTMPSFQMQTDQSGPTWIHYTANEGTQPQTYVERYYFKNGRALQLRCIRPNDAKLAKAWIEAFDHGCKSIADELE